MGVSRHKSANPCRRDATPGPVPGTCTGSIRPDRDLWLRENAGHIGPPSSPSLPNSVSVGTTCRLMGNAPSVADPMLVGPKRKAVRQDLYCMLSFVPTDGANRFFVMTQKKLNVLIHQELKHLGRPDDAPMTGTCWISVEKHESRWGRNSPGLRGGDQCVQQSQPTSGRRGAHRRRRCSLVNRRGSDHSALAPVTALKRPAFDCDQVKRRAMKETERAKRRL